MRLAIVVLVVLVACSSSAPRETTPVPPVEAGGTVAVDAAVHVHVRADAAPVANGACDWNWPDPANPRCAPEHRPLMRCRDVNGPSARFPKCLAEHEAVAPVAPLVRSIKRRGAPTGRGIPIVVDGGTNLGVDQTWRAVILDAKQRPLPHGELSCFRIDPDELECLSRLTLELSRRGSSVRLTPPVPSRAATATSFVLAIERLGDPTDRGLPVVIAGGTRHGIDKLWRADLVDAEMRALANGRLTYVRLGLDTIEGVVPLTKDQAARAKGVRFTAP